MAVGPLLWTAASAVSMNGVPALEDGGPLMVTPVTFASAVPVIGSEKFTGAEQLLAGVGSVMPELVMEMQLVIVNW
jgi:hypothetical protein